MELVLKILVAVILPALIALVSERKKEANIKRLLLTCGAVMLLSNIVGVGALFLLSRGKTIYELLLVSSTAAVLISQLVLPLIRDRKIDHVQVLTALCFCSIVAAVYSILTYGRTMIHSDTATSNILNKSQIASGSLFPKGWNYVNGDVWVITISTFTLPFVALMENQPLARMLGSALYVLICIAALIYHSKSGFGNKSWVLSIPILLLFFFQSDFRIHSALDCILYQAAYTSSFAWIALCSLFTFRVHSESCKKRNYAVLALLMLALCMAGIRNFAEQVVPLLVGYVAFLYAQIREEDKVDWKRRIAPLIRVCSAILVPSVIGYGMHLWITSKVNMVHTVNDAIEFAGSLNHCWNNLVSTILNFFACFGYVGETELFTDIGIRNMVSVIMCLILVFIVPILQAKKLKKETPFVQFFFWYGMVHNLIMLILAVFFSKLESRYLLTSVFVFILISARYIYVYWINQRNFRKVVWTGLFVIASLIYVFPLLGASAGWVDSLTAKQEISAQLISRGVTKGYATYWNAYSNEVYSNSKVRFGSIEIGDEIISHHVWLVDDSAYEVEDTRSCLLLSDAEVAALPNAHRIFIEGAAEALRMDGLNAYIFDYDIASTFKRKIRYDVIGLDQLAHNDKVIRSESGFVVKSEGIVYGPYRPIDPGTYQLRFVGSGLENCSFYINSLNRPHGIQFRVVRTTDTACVIQFSIATPISDIEFVTTGHSDTNPGTLDYIEVEYINEKPGLEW